MILTLILITALHGTPESGRACYADCFRPCLDGCAQGLYDLCIAPCLNAPTPEGFDTCEETCFMEAASFDSSPAMECRLKCRNECDETCRRVIDANLVAQQSRDSSAAPSAEPTTCEPIASRRRGWGEGRPPIDVTLSSSIASPSGPGSWKLED